MDLASAAAMACCACLRSPAHTSLKSGPRNYTSQASLTAAWSAEAAPVPWCLLGQLGILGHGCCSLPTNQLGGSELASAALVRCALPVSYVKEKYGQLGSLGRDRYCLWLPSQLQQLKVVNGCTVSSLGYGCTVS